MPTKNILILVLGIGVIAIVIAFIFERGKAGPTRTSMDHGMMGHSGMQGNTSAGGPIDRNTKGLSEAKPQETVILGNGQNYTLEATFVKKEIAGRTIRMLGYNGQVPGPLLRVQQGDTITVDLKNSLDENTTIHWHGVRVENKFDGVPDGTQAPVRRGETFTYHVTFPDAGFYWYHPHTREDYEQELGLYGLIWVEPTDHNYFNPVHRQEFLVLDDLLLGENDVASFSATAANHALMGRYGNTMFINGAEEYTLAAKKGEVVRFAIVNTANARPFKLAIPGVKMKLVGGDSGTYDAETFVESIILSPSERAIVEVHFEKSGKFELLNETPATTTIFGTITVGEDNGETDYSAAFNRLRGNLQGNAAALLEAYRTKPVDKTINLTINTSGMGGMGHGMLHGAETPDGIEWEDTSGMMNEHSTSKTLKWVIQDAETKKENMAVTYAFKQGEKVKIKIFNDPKSLHPMQHPMHFHGNRFLILSVNGVAATNPVWKDTVLVPSGQAVEILLDASNPGTWMAHCHIAEHLQASMMIGYTVK